MFFVKKTICMHFWKSLEKIRILFWKKCGRSVRIQRLQAVACEFRPTTPSQTKLVVRRLLIVPNSEFLLDMNFESKDCGLSLCMPIESCVGVRWKICFRWSDLTHWTFKTHNLYRKKFQLNGTKQLRSSEPTTLYKVVFSATPTGKNAKLCACYTTAR